MSNVPTIHNARDYVNYVFNISTRGVAEVTSEIFGLSSTVQNVLGNLAFKTSEYLSHAEATTVGFGIAAAGAYVGATKRAIEFQQATANVEAISGKQLIGSEVGAQAMEMSSKFGMAIEDMTSGLESLARAGVTAKSSIDALLESGTQMAKFEGTDLETSMNDLISTVNLLTSDMDVNSEAYAKRVADVNQHIISTSESSPINAHDIINSLQHVGGYASSTNLDQDDLFAVIAQLGSKGTKGEITGTSLRAFISAGQKDTAQRALSRVGLNVTDLWDETGESILSISQMKDVLDDALEAKGYSKQQKLEFYSDFVGYKQANQIMKIDTSEVEHYRSAIDNAMNLTDKMNITLGTVQGNWSQIVSTGVNFMTKVGSKMLPIINAILIPIKMIVGFLDKMPFADWIVGAGLGFVAIKGIAKAVQILVPTMLTFIYKFTDLKKDSFSIHNIFEQWVEDLKQARSILMSMRDKDEMEKIVDEREAEHTNKYLSQLNEKDAINEYMRQKFGTRTTSIGGRERTYYKWDQMSETQREYYRNKYRPSEDIIKNFIKHRKRWFEEQWNNADDTWEPSSGEWPRGDAHVESNVVDDEFSFQSDVLSYYNNFQQSFYQIIDALSDTTSENSTRIESNSGVEYNKSNRERNAEQTEPVLDILNGTIGSTILSDLSDYQMIKNRTSVYDPRDRKVPDSIDDVIKNLEDYYKYGRFYIYNKNSGLGASQSSEGRFIRINAKKLSAYDDSNAIQTIIHELAHMTLSPYERKTNADGKTLYNPNASRSGDKNYGYDTKENHIGTEAEANIAQIITAQMLGEEGNLFGTKGRMNWMLYQMDDSEDINLDLINPLVNEAINNTEAVFSPMVKALREFNGSKHLKEKANKVADDIQKYIDASKENNLILEDYRNQGVDFSDISVSARDLYGVKKSQDFGRRKSATAADVFNLSQGTAASRIVAEKERIKQKMDEFQNNKDVIFNAYKKNIVTSAMTEDGRKFAKEKNQRQLFDFLNHGLENVAGKDPSKVQNYFKGGIFNTNDGKTQWDMIQDYFSNAEIEYREGKWKDDDFLQSFGGLSPDEFLNKYQGLTREADKMRVMNALLQFGDFSADRIMHTREVPNRDRRNLITNTDYENISQQLGIDFSSASNKEEKHAILRDWLKNNSGREDEVTSILMEHEDVLAKTMESSSHNANLKFLQALQASGQYDVSDLLTDFMSNSQYSHFKLYDKLKKEFFLKDENGNYLSDEQQPLLQFSKQFWGDWATFGKAAQYELSIHFAEIEKLAQRAEVTVNDFNANTGTSSGGSDGGPSSGPSGGSDSGPSGSSDDGASDDISDERREQIKPQMERLQAFVDKFYAKIFDVSDSLFGKHVQPEFTATSYGGHIPLDTTNYIPPTNRVTKFLYDKLKDVDSNAFTKQIDKINDKIDESKDYLELWRDAFNEVGKVFPPFIAAGMALQGVIEGLTIVTTILTTVESGLANMRKLEGVFSIFKNTKLGGVIKTFGEGASRALTKVGGMISNVVMSLASSLMPLAPIILPIIAAILAVVAALKLSQDAHDKYLEKLKKEQKEIVAEDKANQALYESARKQRRAGYRNRAAKNFGDIQYEVAQERLHASNLKRQINARKTAEQESDALWGTYGERARLQKMDWGQSIGAYIIPFVGTIAKAMAGEFKSTASEYTGSTEQIRQIKESTINNPRATGSQKMAAAYFDANQAQLSMIDNYKSELGELYDTETKLIRMYGSKESARNSALFKESVEKFAEKVGIDVETAKKMLDYMQVEHNVETASTAMKARADSIVNETEQKALAAANGADMDILLNGSTEEQTKLMVQAQADSIKQQAADSLWWKAVWSSFSAMFWQAVSPLTLIYNILTYIWYGVMALVSAGKNPLGTLLGNNQELNNNLRAMDVSGKNIQNSLGDMVGQGPEAKKARISWEGYNKIQNEDLYSRGMSSISDLDRANYGNGGGSLSRPNVVPLAPKDYQEDTTNATNTESKTTSQSTSWWDALFKPQDNTVTQKASTKTASAQTETSKAQTYQQGYNNLHAMDVSGKNIQDSLGDMIGQGPEAKKAQTYQQGYNKIQKVEVTNQDDSTTLQNISNEIIGLGILGIIARRYNIGGAVGSINKVLTLLSRNDLFKQGTDLLKALVKGGKASKAAKVASDVAKHVGKAALESAKNVSSETKTVIKDGAKIAKGAVNKVKDVLEGIETLDDVKNLGKKIGKVTFDSFKGSIKSVWNFTKNGTKSLFSFGKNSVKSLWNIGKGITKNGKGFFSKILFGEQVPGLVTKNGISSMKNGGIIPTLKHFKQIYNSGGKNGVLKALHESSGTFRKVTDLWYGKEVPGLVTEAGAPSVRTGGLKAALSDSKNILSGALENAGGIKGLASTTKSGIIEGLNPKTALTGAKEIGIGLKGGGTLLKGASKVAGPAAAVIGGITTFMEEYGEHDPSKKHYNEDGTEKKAFQSTGEVVGSTAGAVAGGLGGAIAGAEVGGVAGAAIGSVVPGVGTAIGGAIGTVAGGIIGGIVGEETMRQWGDAIGGTLGWVGDQLWNLVPEQGKAAWNTITKFAGDAWDTITKTAGNAWEGITGTLSGFGKWLNDATGGVSGQIWNTLVGTNEQSDRLVKGALGYTPIGAGINLASDVYNWLTGSGDNTNTSSYQPQTAEATQKGVEEAQKNKRTQGTKTSIVIENININTEDDPEKIKTALMNLIIELQEQVSPRMVSRTIGEPAQASSDTEEDSKTKKEEEALKKQQSGSSTTTTLS